MDQHPDQSDLDAPVSNPEAEENRLVHHNEESEFESEGEEEEEEDEGEESEDPSGLTNMNQLQVTGPDRRSPEEEMIIARMRRHQEERQYLEQKEMRDDYLSSPPAHFPGNGGSKSTTPSPSSPPQQQYLYAANLMPLFDTKIKQDMAMAAMMNPQRLPLLPSSYSHLGGGDSSTGSATPPNNGISLSASPRPGDQDQSKYTFEEQFKQVLDGYSSTKNKNRTIIPDGVSFKKVQDIYSHQSSTSKSKDDIPDLISLTKLYEITDDPGRKEFLDDLFNFMQRLGKPVNRIPIMAKQVLDLYELYRLVVARGGLVEVINKKIWREITKGLNLPSSITSAAFTLRTQYMKYLYAYECEKERLSTQEELQAAIDGNRREGRRAGYSPYGDMVPPPRNNHHPPLPSHASPLSLVSRHMNGHGPNPGHSSGRGTSSPLSLSYYTPPPSQHNNNSTPLPLNLVRLTGGGGGPQENGLYNSNHTMSSGEEENCNSVPSTPNPLMMPQQEALNLEVSRNSDRRDHKPLSVARKNHNPQLDDHVSPKRLKLEEDRLLSKTSNMPSTNIRITSNSHPDGRSLDEGSLMVSMEVNGTMYTGVLYASRIPKNRH